MTRAIYKSIFLFIGLYFLYLPIDAQRRYDHPRVKIPPAVLIGTPIESSILSTKLIPVTDQNNLLPPEVVQSEKPAISDSLSINALTVPVMDHLLNVKTVQPPLKTERIDRAIEDSYFFSSGKRQKTFGVTRHTKLKGFVHLKKTDDPFNEILHRFKWLMILLGILALVGIVFLILSIGGLVALHLISTLMALGFIFTGLAIVAALITLVVFAFIAAFSGLGSMAW